MSTPILTETHREVNIVPRIGIDPNTGKQKLTKHQLAFADAYVGLFSLEKAALAAGCSPKGAYQSGKNMYNLPHVRAYIEEKKKDYLEGFGFSKERVIAELCKQSFIDMKNFAEWDTEWDANLQRYVHHVNVKNSNEIDTSCVKSVKVNQRGAVEIELYDKQNAIEKLVKILGLNAADRVELTGAGGGAIQVDDLRNKLIERLNKISDEANNGSEESNPSNT